MYSVTERCWFKITAVVGQPRFGHKAPKGNDNKPCL